jgi:hypothetical protein
MPFGVFSMEEIRNIAIIEQGIGEEAVDGKE